MSSARRYAVFAVVAVLAIAGAFVAGRFSAPLKVQTIDTVKVAFQDRVVEVVKTVEVKAKAKTKIVYRDRVTAKDGTVTEHEVEKTEAKENAVKTDDGAKVSDRVQTVEKIVQTTVTLRPDWRVALQVGGSLRDPFLKFAGPLVLGAEVDRRIIGGLSAGLWINTYGAAGVALSFEF